MHQRPFSLALPALLSVAGATLLTACGGDDDNVPSTPPVVAKPLELTIAHVDDSHSNLDSMNRTFALAGKDVTVDAGGFPRVTAMIQAIRDSNKNVLALHAGDALTDTLYFNRAGQPGCRPCSSSGCPGRAGCANRRRRSRPRHAAGLPVPCRRHSRCATSR